MRSGGAVWDGMRIYVRLCAIWEMKPATQTAGRRIKNDETDNGQGEIRWVVETDERTGGSACSIDR